MILQKSKRVEREAYISSLWKKKKRHVERKPPRALFCKKWPAQYRCKKIMFLEAKKNPDLALLGIKCELIANAESPPVAPLPQAQQQGE